MYLFKLFIEHHNIKVTPDRAVGKFTFCDAFHACPDCKILSICRERVGSKVPTITKMELEKFKLESPEYFV